MNWTIAFLFAASTLFADECGRCGKTLLSYHVDADDVHIEQEGSPCRGRCWYYCPYCYPDLNQDASWPSRNEPPIFEKLTR